MHYKDIINLSELRNYANDMNRRAHDLRVKGKITADILRGVILESAGKCAWCNCNLVNQDFEIDHILALINDGHHHADNLAMTCISCNRRKGEKHPSKFALEIIAETGIQTPLIKHLIDQYHLKPQQQKSLFDTDDDQSISNTWVYTPPSE